MISSYGDQSTTEIILHIIIVLHNAASIALNAWGYLMFYTCNYNIRVTHRNGTIKHVLHESDPRKGIISRLFFYSFCLAPSTLHLAVKILLQIFLYEDLSTLLPHTSVNDLYFPPECRKDPHFVTQPILLSENIP